MLEYEKYDIDLIKQKFTEGGKNEKEKYYNYSINNDFSNSISNIYINKKQYI